MRFVSELVALMEARAFAPANLPATIMSAALNKSCRMLDRMSGMVNNSIFENKGPVAMSISYFFDCSLFIKIRVPHGTSHLKEIVLGDLFLPGERSADSFVPAVEKLSSVFVVH